MPLTNSAALALMLAFAPCIAQQTAPTSLKTSEQPDYAGSDVCATCHEDIAKSFAKSPHASARRQCESCHGPGGKHIQTVSAADIRNPAKLSVAATDENCLGCHRNKPTSFGRIQSTHGRNATSCIGCHSIHGSRELVPRKPADINAQCEGCHLDVKASFAQSFRHRVPENAMTCVDCHNPHGGFRPGLMRVSAANEPGCFSCHGDKRGPFAFEHPPVREEGCEGCHEPHGSSNPKMLIRQEVRFVCLECHANLPAPNSSGVVAGVVPPAFHDLNSPRYQNCTICHQTVHGSHIDRNLLR